ncbi:CbiX/SirB N-terminal domain-containing protein [Halorubrum tebenquichense]|uniref:Cobalamin (Vitamin B12) biosynthesis CbiX protein n=1 Tax=Halorubrum tebenquichense DSM 14210 TaxID=1227485 RepID=M0E089_9EURY|nr:CbiX/SirB N-terminal domain-containing protein [Halorubrum tebenquichense]ELZ39764.1 cobalamin (vitamin B12) biosynthesis CbiX protein [Halorubrum tebenquichense DSM 14210]
MPRETLLLVGRNEVRSVAERHADRLRSAGIADAVTTATYAVEPESELRGALSDVRGDRVYAVPMCFAHTHETLKDVPRALNRLSGEVRYCDPIGERRAVTEAIRNRAEAASDADALVLVALGNSRDDHARTAAASHAARLRAEFDEVRTAYLLQSPAVECARYTLDADRAVACPLFVGDCEATRDRIPEQLELHRGGIDYADPFGADDVVTDAIAAAVERARETPPAAAPGPDLVADADPVATDGSGRD